MLESLEVTLSQHSDVGWVVTLVAGVQSQTSVVATEILLAQVGVIINICLKLKRIF